jgi:ABC-2 type transport system ATP-binding protein
MDAIEIEGVSKKFRETGKVFWALKDVSFTVRKGEIFGLLGPNGAGKTTLLNILVRLLIPDSGKIRILGEDIAGRGRVLEKINFVSGDTKFHWVLTVEDVLKFYSIAYNLPPAVRKERVEELIEFFGISYVRNRRFNRLSTGERMRLIFAKAMLNHPRVLLLDEPTLGLDPAVAIRVRAEIKRVNRKFGTTILLTSHYMSEVEQLSERIAFIHRGEIIDMGKVEKVKLKRFGSYDVIVKIKGSPDMKFLQAHNFQVSGNVLKRRLLVGENLSNILSLLHRKGYEILDVQTKKPTLEDYFVRILKEGKKA